MTDAFALPQLSSRATRRAAANSDPNNWSWNSPWHKYEGKELLAFYKTWYGADAAQNPNLGGNWPTLDVGQLTIMRKLDFRRKLILVRDCYVKTFQSVYSRALQNPYKGTIITGQPGTGKTFFLFYFLARLLQQKQVVLFSPTGRGLFLFYHGDIYTATEAMMTDPMTSLPRRNPETSHDAVFIWSLFDMTDLEPPTPILWGPCYPVQTASPNVIRFREWEKQKSAHRLYFSLWTAQELSIGFRLHPAFPHLQNVLGGLIQSETAVNGPLPPGISAILDLINDYKSYQTEKQGGALSVDGAVQYLLETAIGRFGYVARDVFEAIFDWNDFSKKHMAAIPTSYAGLLGLVKASYAELLGHVKAASDTQLDRYGTDYRIIAIYPVVVRGLPRDFYCDFKSPWIRAHVLRQLQKASDDDVRCAIKVLRGGMGDALVGHLFEPLAHRTLCGPPQQPWALITMESKDPTAASPMFTPSTLSTVEFTAIERIVEYLAGDLPDEFIDKKYYVPMPSNFPLIDAYTVDFGEDGSAVLWLIQIASSMFEGSDKGYIKVRNIMKALKRQMNGQTARSPKRLKSDLTLHVRWLRVVGDQKRELPHQREWNLPIGWNETVRQADHRGDVYCLEIPLV